MVFPACQVPTWCTFLRNHAPGCHRWQTPLDSNAMLSRSVSSFHEILFMFWRGLGCDLYIWAMPANRRKGRKQRTKKVVAERRSIERNEALEAWREYFTAQENEQEKTARLRQQRLALQKNKLDTR